MEIRPKLSINMKYAEDNVTKIIQAPLRIEELEVFIGFNLMWSTSLIFFRSIKLLVLVQF